MSTSSIPANDPASVQADSPSSTESRTPPLQKKLLLFKHPRHPRFDTVDATQHVYDHSRYVTPISALTPSKIMPSSRQVRRQQPLVTFPAAVIKYYEKLEPFLFPVLFPLGLASATLQSLPMVLSVLPLAFLFGLAAVVVIPLICLGGVTASSYVLARAAVKLLSRRAGVRLDVGTVLLLAKEWNSAAVKYGAKGGQAVKSAVEVLMMGTVTLGALASVQPQAVPAINDKAEEDQPSLKPSVKPTQVLDSSEQSGKGTLRSRPRSKSNARVNFADDLPNDLPPTAVPLPPLPSSSPSKGSKAQTIFQSLLLAPNNQSLAYNTVEEIGSELETTSSQEAVTRPSITVSTRSVVSGNNQLVPPSPESPMRSGRRHGLDEPLANPESLTLTSPLDSSTYFTLSHHEGSRSSDDPEGLTTPTSASTPGYTPMTPMTPMTPHLPYQQLPSSPSLAKASGSGEGKTMKSVSFALHQEVSAPYAMSSLEAALTKLNSQQMQADEILELRHDGRRSA